MNYRDFGRTGLRASEVVFGGGWVGGILIDADDDTRRRAIRMALDGGINWIDTAPMYGDGKSEAALGWLLAEIDDTPIISTKVYLDTAKLDDIPGQVEASLAASLGRLKRDSVDVFLLHNAIRGAADGHGAVGVDDVLRPGGILDALDAMRGQGLVRFIGLTAVGEAAACREVIASGRIDAAQVYYNMLNPSAARASKAAIPGHDNAGLIAACKEHGAGVMAIRVLAAGVLATELRHGREGPPMMDDAEIADEEARARQALALLEIDAEGNTAYGARAQAALRYVLANPDVSCAVVGLATLEHLELALAAAEMGPLPAEAVARLDARFT